MPLPPVFFPVHEQHRPVPDHDHREVVGVGERATGLAEDPAHRLAVTDKDKRPLAEHPQREDVSVVPSTAVQETERVCAHLDELADRILLWAGRQHTVHGFSSGNHPVTFDRNAGNLAVNRYPLARICWGRRSGSGTPNCRSTNGRAGDGAAEGVTTPSTRYLLSLMTTKSP